MKCSELFIFVRFGFLKCCLSRLFQCLTHACSVTLRLCIVRTFFHPTSEDLHTWKTHIRKQGRSPRQCKVVQKWMKDSSGGGGDRMRSVLGQVVGAGTDLSGKGTCHPLKTNVHDGGDGTRKVLTGQEDGVKTGGRDK